MKGKARNVLGRGLDALIPTLPADQSSGGAIEVDIERITPNAYQPRDHFDADGLAELAQSIRENGIIQPVILRPYRDDYQLIAGERRWRAAQLAGLRKVPAVVKSLADDKLLETALVENIQRQDLSPLETAKAFRLLIDEHSLTQEDLATRVGMKRPTVANYLRLLSLAEQVRDALAAGRIEMGHARALGALEDPAAQATALQEVLRRAMSVRQAEHLVQRLKAAPATARRGPSPVDPNVVTAERRLQRSLGARVHIVIGRRGAGRIEIQFKSAAELDRLFALLSDDQQPARA
jgi:ParB family chromosome partitioning protein